MTQPPLQGRADAKHVRRWQTRASRAVRAADQRLAGDRSRTELLLDLLDPGWAVALYASTGDEPDTIDLLRALVARGQRVLLPVLSPLGPHRPRHDPAWAWLASMDDLRPGLWGIPEPTGEVLGAEALALADVVLASGLAGGRDGSRVGTGGGWWDRALPHRRPGVPVWLLLHEDEVSASVPHADHDQPVDRLVTEVGVIEVSG